MLQHTNLSLHHKFVQGIFAVRHWQNTYFSSAAGDLKLEQSIYRFLKGQGGYVYVGTLGDVSAVAEFELLFHEIFEMANLASHVIGKKATGYLDTGIQDSLHGRKWVQFRKNIVRLFDIVNRKSNPYTGIRDTQAPLYNFLTKAVVEEQSQQKFPNVCKTREKIFV